MEDLNLKAHCLILISGIRYDCKTSHLWKICEFMFLMSPPSPSLEELGKTQPKVFIFVFVFLSPLFCQWLPFNSKICTSKVWNWVTIYLHKGPCYTGG